MDATDEWRQSSSPASATAAPTSLWDAPVYRRDSGRDNNYESVPSSSAEASPSSGMEPPQEEQPQPPSALPVAIGPHDFGLAVPSTDTVVEFARAAPQPEIRRSMGVQTDGPMPLVIRRPEPLRPGGAPKQSSVAAAYDMSRRLELFLSAGIPMT